VLTFGLVGWGIALIAGIEDRSTHGMSLLPVYVLSFGLGGGVVSMFEADKTKSIRSIVAWVFALAIVLAGCFFMASFVVNEAPVHWVWGMTSGGVLFAMVVFSLAMRSRAR